MKAMILAAGKGTRLLPLTEKIPKPMITISSEPLIVHQLRWLKRGGIRDIVVNLHHLADQIKDHLGTGRRFGVNIQYSEEEELLETGGGVVKAIPYLGDEPFLLLNGDVWTSFRFHQKVLPTGVGIHLVLVPKPDYREQGDFDLQGSLVQRSNEGSENRWVYSGIAYMNPKVFKDDQLRVFSLRDVLFREVSRGRVSGELFDGQWIDIGTHEELKRVRRLML